MFTGWFLVNILAPLLLPVVGILPLALLPIGPATLANVKIMATVKDGQLCWAVIAMGSSTIYELWDALALHRDVPTWAGFALAATIFVMLPAMILAAGGAVFSTPLLQSGPQSTLVAWVSHYKVFVVSLLMTVISATLLTNIHFSLPTEAQKSTGQEEMYGH